MNQSMNPYKKVLSAILAVIVLAVSVNLSWMASVFADTSVTETITDGGLVAENYDSLTAKEMALLRSEYVKGEAHTYSVPGDKDDLVEVDAAAKTIKADPYADGDYVWNPVSAQLSYAGGSEDVTLENGEGSFEYEGNEYTVRVKYALYIAVDKSLQATLLNGTYNLAKAIENLEAFAGETSMFDTLAENIDGLYRVVE